MSLHKKLKITYPKDHWNRDHICRFEFLHYRDGQTVTGDMEVAEITDEKLYEILKPYLKKERL